MRDKTQQRRHGGGHSQVSGIWNDLRLKSATSLVYLTQLSDHTHRQVEQSSGARFPKNLRET